MRGVVCCVLLLCACAGSDLHCDRRLQPINPPAKSPLAAAPALHPPAPATPPPARSAP